ncbi:MAG TPA: response regulator transcription factor [Terriglobia bacterium]|nr:response regulator transcription factor [Terriglobia bacterium]
MKAIRILIADDHPVVRRGVRTLLESREGWAVCGEARTGEEALERVKALKPDILIMDISMPGMRGFEAIRKIHEFDPRIGILTLTIHDTEPMFRGAMEAGAHAYVLKSDLDNRLIEAVEALCENREFYSPAICQTILKRCVEGDSAPEPGTRDPDVLTPRQLEVLRLVARGNSNKEVANILGISNRTVEAHRYQIMSRLHASTLSDLVIFAVRNKIIQT